MRLAVDDSLAQTPGAAKHGDAHRLAGAAVADGYAHHRIAVRSPRDPRRRVHDGGARRGVGAAFTSVGDAVGGAIIVRTALHSERGIPRGRRRCGIRSAKQRAGTMRGQAAGPFWSRERSTPSRRKEEQVAGAVAHRNQMARRHKLSRRNHHRAVANRHVACERIT
eukprot:ctg_999.g501